MSDNIYDTIHCCYTCDLFAIKIYFLITKRKIIDQMVYYSYVYEITKEFRFNTRYVLNSHAKFVML